MSKTGAILWLFPVGLVGYAVWAVSVDSPTLQFTLHEDGLFESLTCIAYLLAGALWCVAARATRRPAWACWMLAILMFGVAGEEISWGQRILGFETPSAIAERNVQQEVNLHNLDGIHGTIRAGALLFISLVSFGIPLGSRFGTMLAAYERYGIPIMRRDAIVLAAAGVAVMVVHRVITGTVIYELDEVGEVLIAVCFLIFARDEARQAGTGSGAP